MIGPMHHHGHLHRDRHGRPLPGTCSLRQTPETLKAYGRALSLIESCIHEGRLLTSQDAMALAGGEARDKETLYSIARRLAQNEGVDLGDLLCDLERRFPDFI